MGRRLPSFLPDWLWTASWGCLAKGLHLAALNHFHCPGVSTQWTECPQLSHSSSEGSWLWPHPLGASCPGGRGMTDRRTPSRVEADKVYSGPRAGRARPASLPGAASRPGSPPQPPPVSSRPRGLASPRQPAGPGAAGRTRQKARRALGGQRARGRRPPQGHRRRRRARKGPASLSAAGELPTRLPAPAAARPSAAAREA